MTDRTEYWRAYHAKRQKNDPKYRARRRKASADWDKRARALAKGDITSWLTTPGLRSARKSPS